MDNLLKIQENNLLTKEILDRYTDELDLKPITKGKYRKNIAYFVDYLSDNGVMQVTKQTILDYKRHLISRNLSPNTINLYLVSLKSFYKWLEINEISKDLSKHIKLVKTSRMHSKGALTIEQALELINSIETNTLKGKRDLALIYLFISTGLRSFEVANADISDIRIMQGKSVLWVQSKGTDSKGDFVVLDYDVVKVIESYLKARGSDLKSDEPIFKGIAKSSNKRLESDSISRIVKSRLRSVSIDSKYISCHSLRHTALSLALSNGASILEVKEMARHSNISSTQIYLHSYDRIENSAESKVASLLKGANLHG